MYLAPFLMKVLYCLCYREAAEVLQLALKYLTKDDGNKQDLANFQAVADVMCKLSCVYKTMGQYVF